MHSKVDAAQGIQRITCKIQGKCGNLTLAPSLDSPFYRLYTFIQLAYYQLQCIVGAHTWKAQNNRLSSEAHICSRISQNKGWYL